jgi:hypothetical protein
MRRKLRAGCYAFTLLVLISAGAANVTAKTVYVDLLNTAACAADGRGVSLNLLKAK